MARVIVAGSRSFDSFSLLQQKLDKILANLDNVEIVSGGAKGADTLGEHYAELRDLAVKRFPANWEKHGKGAGYRRNEVMAKYATHLIAFWDGKSKGTKHMIALGARHGLKVRVVKI